MIDKLKPIDEKRQSVYTHAARDNIVNPRRGRLVSTNLIIHDQLRRILPLHLRLFRDIYTHAPTRDLRALVIQMHATRTYVGTYIYNLSTYWALRFGGPPRLDLRLFNSSACQKHQCTLCSPIVLSFSLHAPCLFRPPPFFLPLFLPLCSPPFITPWRRCSLSLFSSSPPPLGSPHRRAQALLFLLSFLYIVSLSLSLSLYVLSSLLGLSCRLAPRSRRPRPGPPPRWND